ncbi:MAG TPA: hypothetical protein VIG33_16995 [Pseudobdellovibrionaceae bacterium]|jgi:hypothetical protein
MEDKKIKSPLGDIPNPFSAPEGVFTNIEEAKFAIRGVLRAYFGNNNNDDEDDYLFFKASVVRFEENPLVDLELDHRRRIIIFIVKSPTGADGESLKMHIRNQISMQFAVLASDARGRTAMSIYRALDPRAQQAVINSEKQKEKKDVQRR